MRFFNDQTDVVYQNKLFIKFTTAFTIMIFFKRRHLLKVNGKWNNGKISMKLKKLVYWVKILNFSDATPFEKRVLSNLKLNSN